MPTQRESLDTNFKAADRIVPTRYATAANKFSVMCSVCGGTYFVDERTHHEFMRALEFDASDNTFVCVDCALQETDEEHR